MRSNSALSSLANDLPAAIQATLLRLEERSNNDVQQVVRERMIAAEVEQFDELRERRRARQITAAKAQRLQGLTEYTDLLMLQKAYAAVLLKWLGQAVPIRANLES